MKNKKAELKKYSAFLLNVKMSSNNMISYQLSAISYQLSAIFTTTPKKIKKIAQTGMIVWVKR